MNIVRIWIKNARSIALPQSLLPALLAVSAALLPRVDMMSEAASGEFSWWLALIAVFGVSCAHLGMNLADDYFDYRNGVVEKMSVLDADSVRKRMDKCHYMTDGGATERQLRNAIIGFLGMAAVCGVVVFLFRGWVILLLAGLGALLGLSYSGGPLRLSFRGYGELTIGLLFGPLLMMGVQYSACGVLDWSIVLLGVCVGMLVTNILYTHSVIDADNDTKSQKMTFARLLKTQSRQLSATAVFVLAPFVIVGVCVGLGLWHWSYLFVMVLLPLAVFLIRSIGRFFEDKDQVDEPRWWMGPMGNWPAYQKAHIDWFLIRWLPARNLVTFFCLIIMIANVVLAFF